MAHQIRGLVLRVTANVNMYQLIALGLALGTVILGMPGSGGGGA